MNDHSIFRNNFSTTSSGVSSTSIEGETTLAWVSVSDGGHASSLVRFGRSVCNCLFTVKIELKGKFLAFASPRLRARAPRPLHSASVTRTTSVDCFGVGNVKIDQWNALTNCLQREFPQHMVLDTVARCYLSFA